MYSFRHNFTKLNLLAALIWRVVGGLRYPEQCLVGSRLERRKENVRHPVDKTKEEWQDIGRKRKQNKSWRCRCSPRLAGLGIIRFVEASVIFCNCDCPFSRTGKAFWNGACQFPQVVLKEIIWEQWRLKWQSYLSIMWVSIRVPGQKKTLGCWSTGTHGAKLLFNYVNFCD